MIADSSVYWYLPEVDPLHIQRFIMNCSILYGTGYEDFWGEFPTGPHIGGPTRGEINADIGALDPDIYAGRVRSGFPRYPEGIWGEAGIFGANIQLLTDPVLDPYTDVSLKLTAYLVWFGYGIELSKQVLKLTQFHRRGRPDDVE